MKANAKELTLSSVKAAEQSVAVTLNVPTSSSNSGTTTSGPTTATTTIASGGGGGSSGGASGNSDKKVEKSISSNAKNATATALEFSHGSDTKRKVTKNQRQRDVELASKNDEAGPTDVSDSSDSEENNVP